MERRAYKRVKTYMLVKFLCRNCPSYGVVTNISENGMYIDTGMNLPAESRFELLIHLSDEETLSVPAKLSRLVKTAGVYDGICVELLNPPKNYTNFVAALRTAS